MKKRNVGMGLAILLALAGARTAQAAPPCTDDQTLPMVAASGTTTVPVNGPGIAVFPGTHYADPDPAPTPTFSLVEVNDGEDGDAVDATASELPHGGFLVTPASPLTVGQTYAVSRTHSEADNACSRRFEFTVTEAVDLPTSLGALNVGNQVDHAISGAAAEDFVDLGDEIPTYEGVSRSLMLALDASTEAWSRTLLYQTVMDGEVVEGDEEQWIAENASCAGHHPYLGGEFADARHLTMTALCDNAGPDRPWIGEGEHTVKVTAKLLGTDVALSTEEKTFTLDCGDPSPPLDPDPADTAGGCAVSTRASRDGGFLAATLVAVGALWRRRRGRSAA